MTTKIERRIKIKYRVRNKISGTTECPRMSVFRSNKQIYVQIIDDLSGKTLAAASSLGITESMSKKEQAAKVVELQQLLRQGRIVVPVEFVGLPGTGQVHPGRDGDEPAGQLPAQLLQLQAQSADQPTAGALTAQQNLLRRVALFQ